MESNAYYSHKLALASLSILMAARKETSGEPFLWRLATYSRSGHLTRGPFHCSTAVDLQGLTNAP